MSAPSSPDLAHLDTRARDIFRQIVEAYLETGDPVGSRTLSKRLALGLSPASIRNVMQDLVELGLLDSPHISAGRKPTQQGLRLFVDSLLQLGGQLPETERREIAQKIDSAGANMESVLSAASSMLSGLAGAASLVLTPTREAPLRHLEFVAIGADRALVILVFDDGSVENRMMRVPAGLPQSALVEATNFLSRYAKGRTLAEAKTDALEALAARSAELDAAAAALIAEGVAAWSGEDPMQGRSLIVHGRANILSDAASLADLERVKTLFDELERARELLQILDLAREADGVRIFIGSENPIFSLSGSSLIIAPYRNSERRVMGALGVIGPTRLNYARVIPVVDFTAKMIGHALDARPVRHEG